MDLEQIKQIVEKKKFNLKHTKEGRADYLMCGYNIALDSLIRDLEKLKPLTLNN